MKTKYEGVLDVLREIKRIVLREIKRIVSKMGGNESLYIASFNYLFFLG